jgi:hypothetical protein
MATTVQVKIYTANKEGGDIAIADVPVDGKKHPLSELVKPNSSAAPAKIVGDTIYVVKPPPNVEVTIYDQNHAIKLTDQPKRFAGDGANLTEYSLSAKSTA